MKVYIGPTSIELNFIFNFLNKFMDKSTVYKIKNWIDEKFEPKVKIIIHDYDLWNLDVTLAHIIHPALVKLKAKKHGYPQIANEDVPENLINVEMQEKWEWVLDEMIYAFEKTSNGISGLDYRKQRGYQLFGKYYNCLWD